MKTSNYSEDEECSELAGLTRRSESWEDDRHSDEQTEHASQFVSAEDLSVQRFEAQRQKWKDSQASISSSEVSGQRETAIEERQDRWSDTHTSPPSDDVSLHRESREPWSDCLVSPPGLGEDIEIVTSDCEPAVAQCEPASELYYTASSEVSLLSDLEPPEKHQKQDSLDKEEGKELVIAGHVAAMRERFENMTRANTPCPDTVRSASPVLDLYRNITPSPDFLG